MGQKTILAIIPLILSIGIISAFQFSDALQPNDIETQCREGQVLVFRTIANNYVCVSDSTAKRWVELGIAEIVGQEPIEEELVACTADYRPVCSVDGKTYSNMCMLEGAGETFAHSGKCESKEKDFTPIPCTRDYRPVCGVDEKTYGNLCTLESFGVDLAYEGECDSEGFFASKVSEGIQIIETRSGTITLDHDYLTPESAKLLSDELFFQRAVQVYHLALPAIGGAGIFYEQDKVGATTGDVLYWSDFMNSDIELLTGNISVLYFMSLQDLSDGSNCS